ncbi:MAG: alpha/beta hydrolase [Chloroflexi bacterium]|nr:alpha/beta hydrolase [Chloroflexota bacterium]
METVRSKDSTPIAYEKSGKGPPLVLVHGTGGDHTRWVPVLPALERHFTVYAVDRRGRGGSGDTPTYAIEREYEDIVAVVDSIREPVNLLGHSYGALCSLEAALLTRNIRRLVLYEPAFDVGIPMYPPRSIERLQTLLDRGDREEMLVAFMRNIVEMPMHQIDLLRSEPAWKGRLAAAHTIPREFADADYVLAPQRFSTMNTPTLLLVGGESPPILRKPAEALARVLHNCRVAEMPGQQHVAMSTAPDLFCRQVISFLTS